MLSANLEQLGNDIIKAIQDEIERLGQNASGKTSQSIRQEQTDDTLTIFAPQHFGALIYGRKPTEKASGEPLIDKIKDWVKYKNIPEKYAYAITKSIHENGTRLYETGATYNGGNPEYQKIIEEIVKNSIKNITFEIKSQIIKEYIK